MGRGIAKREIKTQIKGKNARQRDINKYLPKIEYKLER